MNFDRDMPERRVVDHRQLDSEDTELEAGRRGLRLDVLGERWGLGSSLTRFAAAVTRA